MSESAWPDIRYRLRPACLLNTLRRAKRAWTWRGKVWTLALFWYNGECCDRCGRRYELWWCPDNELFARVTGRTFVPPYVGGVFCPRCFDKLACAANIVLEWNPRVFIDRSVSPQRENLRHPPAQDDSVLARELDYWRVRAIAAERENRSREATP